ncbi:hypothetical protein NVP1250O_11 [Vibrio phage 1.250.O._10N.261.55.E11]|nr:hypothetical protein NVP1250O_11 [Vibrio phage 1.250.O._10N.261.55.E11]
MKNQGITVFLNDEEITTGDYYMTCREGRSCTLGAHEGEGSQSRLELDVEITNCHTDLTNGKVSVGFFGVVFDGVVSNRETRFAVTENCPNLHNFSVVLLPQPRTSEPTQ